MTTALDLDAYLKRIHWGGTTQCTYETLVGLVAAHVERIPFENLDVLLGRTVRLDTPSLEAKLVHARRGGYCFEHASLFAAVLEALGFAPVRHSARVVTVVARHLSPRTHMFLTVTLPQGTFVLDPGFGRTAPRLPVPLSEGMEARYDEEVHWMARDAGLWVLRTRTEDGVVDCWASETAPDNLIDFEVGSHFVATHPSSPFVSRLMLRAFTDTGQVSVMNRDVTQRDAGGTCSRVIGSRGELRALLSNDFGFDLPEIETMRVPAIPEWT